MEVPRRAPGRITSFLTAAGISLCAGLVSLIVGLIGLGSLGYFVEGLEPKQLVDELVMGGPYFGMAALLIPPAFLIGVTLLFAQLRPAPSRAIKWVVVGFLVALILLCALLVGWIFHSGEESPMLPVALFMLAGFFGPAVVMVVIQAWLVALVLEQRLALAQNAGSIWVFSLLVLVLCAALIIALKGSSELEADYAVVPVWIPGVLTVSALVAAGWLGYLRFGRGEFVGGRNVG